MTHNLHAVTPKRSLARLRYQLIFGLFAASVLPSAIYNLADISLIWRTSFAAGTAIGCTAAFALTLYLFRRIVTFPGVGILGHVLPTCAVSYGLVMALFFGLRLDYSRITFFLSYAFSNLFFFWVSTYLRRLRGQRFYLVPSPQTEAVPPVPHINWVLLEEPVLPPGPDPVLIADLRADLAIEWERLIARTAVAGHPVYHVKQVMESLTGRVEIEHLSENSFGSLVPNLGYRKLKRFIDCLTAPIALLVFLLPFIVVAVAIKCDSPGPVFFRQRRRGYRGEIFEVLKFRTMTHADPDPGDEVASSITQDGDMRITKVGHLLRRTRIDELPQVWNIILGEMSWIGPRPEAVALSDWYERALPFYNYRHIVRPGITGWAQVSQGHVADIGAVQDKLCYDFFYIKNFSAWLDLLIAAKTVRTVFTGEGAK